jgi:hypothetical protein
MSFKQYNVFIPAYGSMYWNGDDVIGPGAIIPFNSIGNYLRMIPTVTGTLTINVDGVYEFSFFVAGSHSSKTPIRVYFAINGTTIPQRRFTSELQVCNGSGIITCVKGDVLALYNDTLNSEDTPVLEPVNRSVDSDCSSLLIVKKIDDYIP